MMYFFKFQSTNILTEEEIKKGGLQGEFVSSFNYLVQSKLSREVRYEHRKKIKDGTVV